MEGMNEEFQGLGGIGGDFVKVHIGIYAIQDIEGCGILRPPPLPYGASGATGMT